MITITKGNILDAKVEALVNPINTVGTMGSGLALQFKNAFPDMHRKYLERCRLGLVHVGYVSVYDCQNNSLPKYIINFPTKRDWREPSKLEYIQSGLRSLVDEVTIRKIRSIAIPALGCGLGKLKWQDVYPQIEKAFSSKTNIEVFIYNNTQELQMSDKKPGIEEDFKVEREISPIKKKDHCEIVFPGM